MAWPDRAEDWATPEDLRRASSPEEAAKALDWQSEQVEIETRRLEVLELLRGDEIARQANYERWAPLRRDRR